MSVRHDIRVFDKHSECDTQDLSTDIPAHTQLWGNRLTSHYCFCMRVSVCVHCPQPQRSRANKPTYNTMHYANSVASPWCKPDKTTGGTRKGGRENWLKSINHRCMLLLDHQSPHYPPLHLLAHRMSVCVNVFMCVSVPEFQYKRTTRSRQKTWKVLFWWLLFEGTVQHFGKCD